MKRSDHVFGDLKRMMLERATAEIKAGGQNALGARELVKFFDMMDSDPLPAGQSEQEYIDTLKRELPHFLGHCVQQDEQSRWRGAMVPIVDSTRRVLLALRGKRRAKAYHKQLDGQLTLLMSSLRADEPISCRKGCFACCYQQIPIHDEEALLLADLVRKGQVQVNESELAVQRNMTTPLLKANPRPCVFLKNGECGVYANRPGTCRQYLVGSDPANCNVFLSPPGEIAMLVDAETGGVSVAMESVSPKRDEACLPVLLGLALDGKL